MITWIKVSERKPEHENAVLISDGHYVAVARYAGRDWWSGEGFGGYEWEWDFEPTHWAEINFALP